MLNSKKIFLFDLKQNAGRNTRNENRVTKQLRKN